MKKVKPAKIVRKVRRGIKKFERGAKNVARAAGVSNAKIHRVGQHVKKAARKYAKSSVKKYAGAAVNAALKA